MYRIELSDKNFELLCELLWEAEQARFNEVYAMTGAPLDKFNVEVFKEKSIAQMHALKLRDQVAENSSWIQDMTDTKFREVE
jgi:hypothetical protein